MAMGMQRLNRRGFLRIAGAGFAACAVPAGVRGYEPLPALKIRRVSLPVGASRPFRVLHVSDSHVARIDSRDTEAMYAFARTRSRMGRKLGEYYLGEAAHHARSAGMKIVHTGDFMDFTSEANLEYASRWLGTYDCLACVGNHEYWNSPEKREVEECKAPIVPRLKGAWDGLPVSVAQMNGVNFFVFDNAFGTVAGGIAARFEKVVGEGRPIVMVCHVPLWAEGCGIDRNVCGKPGLRDDDAVSCAFVERVRREPLVRTVLAGHVHERCDFEFSPTARECVANALFNGEAAEVCFS